MGCKELCTLSGSVYLKGGTMEIMNVSDILKIGIISLIVIMLTKFTLEKMGYSQYAQDI